MGLKNKLIAIVIGVGTVPLILAMIFSYLQGNKSLTQVIGASFQALAYETSTKIDLLMKPTGKTGLVGRKCNLHKIVWVSLTI